MSLWQNLWKQFNRKIFAYIVCVILPLTLLPLGLSCDKELRCIYVILIVAAYWVFEPVPITVTALLPIVLYPSLGVVGSSEICKNYMKENLMMYIGCFLMAEAVEDCKLHERIAFKVLLLIGTEIKWLMLGFMITSMLLAMWISNAAATALMVPIVEAVLLTITLSSNCNDIQLEETHFSYSSHTEIKQVSGIDDVGNSNYSREQDTKCSTLKVVCLLCVCYASNIGGAATLTGAGPNLVLKEMMEEIYPDSTDITFGTWVLYNVPGMLICIFISWFYLWLVYVRHLKINNVDSKEKIEEIISQRYFRLGPISVHEVSVMMLFLILLTLWVLRDPKFIHGWTSFFPSDMKIGSATPAIAVAFLLFFLPSIFWDLNSRPLLEWKSAQSKLPWGVLLLLGGGFALAHGVEVSGLSTVLGEKLFSLKVLSPGFIVVIVCLVTAMITELASNTVSANIVLPVLNQMALSIGVNPLFLMLPASIVCSYGFMFPVATPSNAIAFENGNMKTTDMIKPGLFMNLMCCGVQLFMVNTLGVAMFDLKTFPSWAIKINMTAQNVST